MILIINICRENLHYFEFVKPIEEILKNAGMKYFTKHYLEIDSSDLENCYKVIICGTSLSDNEFMKNIKKFLWVKDFEKPILGICAGMQIVGLVFGGNTRKHKEIGFFHEGFAREFLGVSGEVEVYHLHNYYVDFEKLDDFEIFSMSKIPQAIKHKEKEIYGVLFHPEVRNKDMIVGFVNG